MPHQNNIVEVKSTAFYSFHVLLFDYNNILNLFNKAEKQKTDNEDET